MNRDEITTLVEASIDQLIAEQRELLAVNVTERNLSHHLANYIAQRLPPNDGLSVDVEYNRHGANPKRLLLPQRQALDRELRAATVFPDIIIHRRNSDECNLLVLEMKKPNEELGYDDLKLRQFRKELGYLHTAHVVLGCIDGEVFRKVIWIDG
jgi:hypothetical protein